jgi:hypothetical protein
MGRSPLEVIGALACIDTIPIAAPPNPANVVSGHMVIGV